MPLPGAKPTNQTQVIEQNLATQVKEVTDILKLPGIEKLHLKSTDEIASVLANVLKSRPGVVSFKYVVGSHVEIVCDSNPLNQFRG